MSQSDVKISIDRSYIMPILIIGLIITGCVGFFIYVLSPALNTMNESSHKISEKNEIEEKEIKLVIESNAISCEYVAGLRMNYAGDPHINALDDSWIKSKLRTYWNTHSCGVEWGWWD